MDMNDTIIAKSDQLNADDLIGRPITIKITNVTLKKGADQPCIINFEGDNGKPYKPSKGMRRILVFYWGDDQTQYIGRSMTLYRDEEVKWAGAPVGGIQISHMSDMLRKDPTSLTVSRGVKKPYQVKPLQIQQQQKPAALASSETTSADAGAIKELTENQKNYLKIKEAIAAARDDIELFDLWHSGDPDIGFAKELEAIKAASEKHYEALLTLYNEKKATFPPDFTNA